MTTYDAFLLALAIEGGHFVRHVTVYVVGARSCPY